MYAIFKYLTVSPSPNVPKPSIFDFAGKAKWDAWQAAGKTYEGQPADAENRYLEIARSLGWKEGQETQAKASSKEQAGDDEGEEDIWDSDSDGEERAHKGDGGAMGRITSTMIMEDEQTSSALSNLAIEGDVESLRSHLQEHPDEDVNARDENVSHACTCPASPAHIRAGIHPTTLGCRQRAPGGRQAALGTWRRPCSQGAIS